MKRITATLRHQSTNDVAVQCKCCASSISRKRRRRTRRVGDSSSSLSETRTEDTKNTKQHAQQHGPHRSTEHAAVIASHTVTSTVFQRDELTSRRRHRKEPVVTSQTEQLGDRQVDNDVAEREPEPPRRSEAGGPRHREGSIVTLSTLRNQLPDRPADGSGSRNVWPGSVLLPSSSSSSSSSSYTLCPKKRPTFLLSVSSPYVNGFSRFFHWHILWTISNEVIIQYPTTSSLCC